jgi:hypothetical protein
MEPGKKLGVHLCARPGAKAPLAVAKAQLAVAKAQLEAKVLSAANKGHNQLP